MTTITAYREKKAESSLTAEYEECLECLQLRHTMGERVVPNQIESSWNVWKEPSFVKVTWLGLLLLESYD